MSSDDMITSALRRSLKLGGLVGRVGTSVLGSRLLEIGRGDEARRKQRADNLVRNAQRIVDSLGRLKGAAMKVGQMLSLQDGLLPAEVAEVLRTLQQQAPQVPPEVMHYEVEGALGSFDAVFEWMAEDAFAAASIGQVHRARLLDGTDVAVKIQYPLIDEIVRADLANLKVLVGALFALVSDVDFEPFWNEIRDRLSEELDYTIEAASMRRMAALYKDVPEVVIPGVVGRASRRTVLRGVPAGAQGSLRWGPARVSLPRSVRAPLLARRPQPRQLRLSRGRGRDRV
jgi:predicted unusual protein kinase regulating ubiquinone biosynthesis (AarF/ABC1/UbiB family)